MSNTADLTSEQILSASDIGDRVTRLAREILESVGSGELPNFVGVFTRGVTLARRVAAAIEKEKGDMSGTNESFVNYLPPYPGSISGRPLPISYGMSG